MDTSTLDRPGWPHIYGWLLLLCLFACSSTKAPMDAPPEYRTALDILARELELGGLATKLTGPDRLQAGGHEIVLEAPVALPDGQFFTITSKGGRGVKIEARDPRQLIDASYSLLREVGFDWLLPNPNWNIVPELTERSLSGLSVVGSPAYPYADLLPSRSVSKSTQYERWLRRLGTYSATPVKTGHYGYRFNRRYRKEIMAHPEWLAVNGGKRVKYSKNVKLDYTHPEVIALWKQDAERRLRQMMEAGGEPPYFISVEPPDGKGFTEAPYRKGAGVSDQVFGLANEVARHLRAVHPGAHASLLAYTAHSTPPSFSLEPNVAVVVTTGWFQETASTTGLIALWAEPKSFRGIRHYSGVPKSKDVRVQFPVPGSARSLLDFGAKRGYTIYREQTVFSAGALGLYHYLTASAFDDPSTAEEEIREQYYKKAFGEAAGAMRRMYEQNWYGYEHATDFPESVERIREAVTAATDRPEIQARLTDLMAYLIYLNMAAEIKGVGDEAQIQAVTAYGASIENRKVVDAEHLARHFNVVLRKSTTKVAVPKPGKYPPQLTDAEIRERFAALRGGPAGAARPTAAPAVTKAAAPVPDTEGTNVGRVLELAGSATVGLEDSDRDGTLTLKLAARQPNKAIIYTAIDWFTEEGELISSKKISRNSPKIEDYTITVPKGSAVRATIYAHGSKVKLRISKEMAYIQAGGMRLRNDFPGVVYLPPANKRELKSAGSAVIASTTDGGKAITVGGGAYYDLNQVFRADEWLTISAVRGRNYFIGEDKLYFFR